MRKHVLVVAQETGLRAQFARMLQRAGCVVELADNQKRALKLASVEKINAAIVVQASRPVQVAFLEELGEKIPSLLLLAERSDDAAELTRSLPGVTIRLLRSLSEKQLLEDLALESGSSRTDEIARASAAPFVGDFRLNVAGRIFVRADGREVALTRTELSLLKAFARRPGQVLSRDQLSVAIAGHDAEPYGRSVDMHVSRLRRKIEPDPKAPRFIVTASGGGYKFTPAPQTTGGSREPTLAIDLQERSKAESAGASAIGDAGGKKVAARGDPIDSPYFGPERRQVTVLSCELIIPGLDARSVDPEELAQVVQSFRTVCAAAVASMDGSIAMSAGDEVLAFFGVPRAHEDDAERAAHAGFELIARVGELALAPGTSLQARIGISTGIVVASDKGVVGKPSTAASRLRAVAAPNSILVAPSTYGLLSRAFVCAGPGSYEVPGFSEKITAYALTRKLRVESRFSSMHPQKMTPFIGREHELRQLIALWDRVRAQKGQVGLVCGVAGIGKSRICEVFLERINANPHSTIRWQCSPRDINSPFRPIIEQMEYAARFEQGDTPHVKLKKLEAILTEAGSVSLADMQSFAGLLSIPTDQPSPLGSTPRRQKDLVISALVQYVLRLARTQPVVIKLADVHWADSSTLELLSRIIASIRTAQVFVLTSFRPEFFPSWVDEPHATMLRLDRLGRAQTDAMIFDVARQKRLPANVQAEIISRADGVPLFVEELTKSVLESGVFQDAGDELVTVAPVPSLAIPCVCG